MTTFSILYKKALKSEITHLGNQERIYTEAPKDNQGKGEHFSPTDLLASASGSCVATLIGIYAQKKGWDLEGMRLEVDKKMTTQGVRRLERLSIEVWFPLEIEESEKQKVIEVAKSCPVHLSLHPDVEIVMHFHWKKGIGPLHTSSTSPSQ